jgi:hypothetical protein
MLFYRFLGFWFDALRGTKVQSSGLSFAAANPSKAKARKPIKAGIGSEKRRNAQPQAKEAREANARR